MHGSCWPLTLVSDETVSALHVLVLKIVSWIYFFPATRAIWLNVSVASSVARSKKKKKKKLRCSPFASWYSKGKQEKAGKDACHWAQHWVGTETPFQTGLSVPVFNSMLFTCMLVLWSLDLCCSHWLSSGILQVSYKDFSAPLNTSVLVVSRLFILPFSIDC